MINIISSITSSLHIHLNINQNILINSSIILFSLEKLVSSSLSNQLNISQIDFPSNIIHSNSTVLIRVN
jgi:hypothetical protein